MSYNVLTQRFDRENFVIDAIFYSVIEWRQTNTIILILEFE